MRGNAHVAGLRHCVVEVNGNKVRVSIDAPHQVSILWGELARQLAGEPGGCNEPAVPRAPAESKTSERRGKEGIGLVTASCQSGVSSSGNARKAKQSSLLPAKEML